MLVQDVMQSPVITVPVDTSLSKAYQTMHEHTIRHLPVLDGDTLVGVVTDRDLRYATSQLHPSPVEAQTEVRSVMSENPITAGPLDPVEEAARLLRKERIGCLPVLDGTTLAGIVTVTNLLDAVIRLTGLEKPGGRLAVSLADTPGQLARLTSRVADAGLDIRSVLSYYERPVETSDAPEDDPENASAETSEDAGDEERLRVILRVGTLTVRPLARRLRDEGFDVVWPIAKPT